MARCGLEEFFATFQDALVVHYLDKADGILFIRGMLYYDEVVRGRGRRRKVWVKGTFLFFFFIGKGLWLRNEELAVEIISN